MSAARERARHLSEDPPRFIVHTLEDGTVDLDYTDLRIFREDVAQLVDEIELLCESMRKWEADGKSKDVRDRIGEDFVEVWRINHDLGRAIQTIRGDGRRMRDTEPGRTFVVSKLASLCAQIPKIQRRKPHTRPNLKGFSYTDDWDFDLASNVLAELRLCKLRLKRIGPPKELMVDNNCDPQPSGKAVTLLDVALAINDDGAGGDLDVDAAKDARKRWHNSRQLKLPEKLGKAADGRSALYSLTAILEFVKQLERLDDATISKARKTLQHKLQVVRPA